MGVPVTAPTKGPWEATLNLHQFHPPGSWVVHEADSSDDVYHAICSTGNGSESEANARLIAAAPTTKQERDELREALKELTTSLADWGHGPDCYVEEGSTNDPNCDCGANEMILKRQNAEALLRRIEKGEG
jgi:hypothetical protein